MRARILWLAAGLVACGEGPIDDRDDYENTLIEGRTGDEAAPQEEPFGEDDEDLQPEGAVWQPTIWPGADDPEPVRDLVAVLHGAEGYGDIHGEVHFTRTEEGLRVQSEVHGLPQGMHAYHVHVYGDCSAPDLKSAGPHYDWQGRPEDVQAQLGVITGDLGELEAGAEGGTARAEQVIEEAQLGGDTSIIGRAVVVHAQGNDPSQPPDGGAGDRIACGVIGIAQ